MANNCMEFLMDSFLYWSDAIDSNYLEYNDKEIIAELQRYRQHVLSNIEKIKAEIQHANDKLNINIETFNTPPDEKLYKQLILYMDQVIIPDPLFELTEERNSLSDTFGEYIGIQKSQSFNREKLVDVINYIKCISPMIEIKFIIMIPISLLHEAPKEIPINYSETAFSDIIPTPILKYYQSIAKVFNVERNNHQLVVKKGDALKLGTSICVDFPDDMKSSSCIYQYMIQEIIEYNNKTGEAKIRMSIPSSIDDITFNAWVKQSINQAANNHFSSKFSELAFAKKMGCMYLTRSSLTAEVLHMAFEDSTKESELANMAMKLDLPVVDQLPLLDIIDIRNNYGEAFHNFRNELNSKLIGLDSIDDPDELKRQLNKMAYELSVVQIEDVKKEYRKISRTLKLDLLACTGSLIASFVTGGLTAVGAAAAFIKGISDIAKYYTNVNEHNGLFLWKLSGQANKYKL